MHIANTSLIDSRTDSLEIFKGVLAQIFEMKEKLGIPMKAFELAPARLKRLGVTFLVTLEKCGKKAFVPFRVEDSAIMYTRFCSKEELASWRGNYIHPINFRYGQTLERLTKKVIQYLRSSFHRFVRKLEKHAHMNSTKRAKRESRIARSHPGHEPFRRMDSHQVGHH